MSLTTVGSGDTSKKNGEVLVPRIVRCIFIYLFYFLNNFNHQVKTENFKFADRQESKARAPGGRSVFRAIDQQI